MISYDFLFAVFITFFIILFAFVGFKFIDLMFFLLSDSDSDYVDCFDACINLEDSNPCHCHNLCCLVFEGGVCE